MLAQTLLHMIIQKSLKRGYDVDKTYHSIALL